MINLFRKNQKKIIKFFKVGTLNFGIELSEKLFLEKYKIVRAFQACGQKV